MNLSNFQILSSGFGFLFGCLVFYYFGILDQNGLKSKKMKWFKFTVLTSILVLIEGCASVVTTFQEPKDQNSVLVIGSVIVDLFEYRGRSTTYHDGLDVVIAARFKHNGKIIHKNYWVKTNSRGYFVLSNVAPGDYTVRGFQIKIAGSSFKINVASPLRKENDEFLVVGPSKIPKGAFYFSNFKQGRIIDLSHNYFIVDRGEIVHHKSYFRYDNIKMVTGKIILEPDVMTYFKRRFQDSQWFTK